MSDPIHPRPPEPLVEKNSFRGRTIEREPILPFNQAKPKLPVPILPEHGDLIEMYWRTWEMVWSNLRSPKRSSGLLSNFIAAGGEDPISMGDTAFMVHFGIYGRRAFPFINALDNFYTKQHDDGAICREIDAENGLDLYTPFDPVGTGPNILAWAEWRNYRISGDEERLRRVFWPLMAFHRWCRANRSWPNGLYWATGMSSGLNIQNRIPGGEHHHQHWTWVDASMQAAVSCLYLERLAGLLTEEEYESELAAEHNLLKEAINQRLWNEEANFYQDIDSKGRFNPNKIISAYWGLLDKSLIPEERLKPFVRHLREDGVFKTKHRIPAVSADSDGYEARNGLVIPPANYIVLKGLNNIGQQLLAHKIANNHLQNLAQVFEHTDTLWENYASEDPSPGNFARPHFIGWTGLSSIAMVLEDVIGLRVDWPTRRVVWNRLLETNRHYGVQNYPVGPGGTVSIMGDQEQITVTTDVPFTLTIRDRSLNLQVPLSVGTRAIDLG